MSLTKCKVCKKPVSASAPTCPHCGETDPGAQSPDQVKNQRKETIVGALAVALLVAIGMSTCSESPADAAKTKEALAKQDAACSLDLQCLGEKGVFAAGAQCPALIERQAKYSVKWTDGTLEPKFSRYKWLDKDRQVITLIGDKAQFQNGFGAWAPVTYACDMQHDSGKWIALDVRVSEGRL